MQLIINFFIPLIISLIFNACGDGSLNDNNVTQKISTVNIAPIANAGSNQNVEQSSVVQLSATESFDANGDTLSYIWTFVSKAEGSTTRLSDVKSATPTFIADISGEYVLALSVNDGLLDSNSSALVTITVSTLPVADAGVDQNVNTPTLVTLDGSLSSVGAGGSLSYLWAFVKKPESSGATLSSATVVKPTFNVDVDGEYEVSLVVSNDSIQSESDSVIITAKTENSAPVANAGMDQDVNITSSVTLDGSTSSDANDDALTYKWSITSKPSSSQVTLANNSIVNPSFTPDVEGTYIFSLVVNDAQLESAADSVSINVLKSNLPPQANAGKDQYVTTLSLVSLDGTLSSDANAESITYSWNMTSKPDSSSAVLTNANTVNPSFTADVTGTYVFSLKVHNAKESSNYDYVTVNVADKNVAPVADAGVDQNVKTLNTVTLNASLSSDANLDRLSYKWVLISKPSSSKAELSSTTSVKPSFFADKDGAYVFQLMVNDSFLDSTTDYVTVNAKTANSVPTAKAGVNQNIITLATVMLNGAESSDPDLNPLSYIWHIVSKPVGSEAFLSDPSIVNPSFLADKDGTYVIQLVVNDAITNSKADTIVITATTINATPVAIVGSNQNVKTGAVAIVDASLSSDADHDVLSYSWVIVSQPEGSLSTLSDASIVNPTFTPDKDGVYVFGVSVNDGTIDSPRVYTTVTATRANSAPVANAGANLNVSIGNIVSLSGLASSDADINDVLSYRWRMISHPSTSSSVTLSSLSTVTTNFTPDVAGAYVFELIVNDSKVDSTPAYITVNAT